MYFELQSVCQLSASQSLMGACLRGVDLPCPVRWAVRCEQTAVAMNCSQLGFGSLWLVVCGLKTIPDNYGLKDKFN